MTLNDAAAIVTIVSGGLGLILMAATLFYTMAIFRGWKPRPWLRPDMTYIIPSKRMLFTFGALGLALLVTSWIMYEWPQKMPEPKIITKTLTKTLTVKVPTVDPAQTAEIERLGRELKAAKLAAPHTPVTKGRQAMVTGNGSSADLNYEFGTDRPLVSGDNTHATGNTIVATPPPPSVLQQQQNQQKVVLQEILQQYFAEHPDANRQVAVPVDYINSELKKRNLDWYVTIPPGMPYTVHSPQNQNESAIFAR